MPMAIVRVSCDRCGSAAYVDCVCSMANHVPGEAGYHHPSCDMVDLGAAVKCPPGNGCCDGSDHPGISHDMHANSCPHIDKGTHGPCPDPSNCKSWHSMHDHRYRRMVEGMSPPPCPGGHCHQDLPDCTVCRTVTIEMMPGTLVTTNGS